MSELRCPCGHTISGERGHNVGGCLHGWPDFDCDCALTEAQALRAAQRKAAAEYVFYFWRERSKCRKFSTEWVYLNERMRHAIAAYRAVGILGQRKGGE